MSNHEANKIRQQMLRIAENTSALLDAVDGYRAQVLERGYSPTAAEQAAMQFHHHLLAAAFRPQRHRELTCMSSTSCHARYTPALSSQACAPTARYHPAMRRTLLILLALTTIAACGSSDEEPPVIAVDGETGREHRQYPTFSDVDPYTSGYFIELEDTTLAATQGEQRLYNLGVGICVNLDRGNSIDQELTGLTEDAKLTMDEAAQMIGAAVTDLCPQHSDTIEAWLDANA